MTVKIKVVETKGTGFLPDLGVIEAERKEDGGVVVYITNATGTELLLRPDQVEEVA